MTREDAYILGCLFAVNRLIENGGAYYGIRVDGKWETVTWAEIKKWCEKQYGIEQEVEEQEPRKIGRWIDDSRTLPLSDVVKHCVRCSNCGTHWDYATRYCPYCGSKMEDGK